MKLIGSYKILILAAVIVISAIYLLTVGGSKKAGDGKLDDNKTVALVKTEPVKEGTIKEIITVYGITIPAPGAVQTVSVPYESQIRNVMITDGQLVSKGDVLLEIEPSPDTNLQLEVAKNKYESSRLSLQHVERLFKLKLATNDQVTQATQTFREAELNLESLKKRGINRKNKIYSDSSGLIKQVHVQEGQIIPAGGTLVEIVLQNRLEARLGVEPEDIGEVNDGQEVLLSPVNVYLSHNVEGKIRKISGSVNPSTRLVDVFVSLSENTEESKKILLGESIVGRISVARSTGFIVPRSAVLPEDSRFTIFTVENNKAVKHYVQKGLENEEEVEIKGSDIKTGDLIVVLGNYELEGGMLVKVETSK